LQQLKRGPSMKVRCSMRSGRSNDRVTR
jgi:hypothetical protein